MQWQQAQLEFTKPQSFHPSSSNGKEFLQGIHWINCIRDSQRVGELELVGVYFSSVVIKEWWWDFKKQKCCGPASTANLHTNSALGRRRTNARARTRPCFVSGLLTHETFSRTPWGILLHNLMHLCFIVTKRAVSAKTVISASFFRCFHSRSHGA